MTIDISNVFAQISPEWNNLPIQSDIQITSVISYAEHWKGFVIVIQITSHSLELVSTVLINCSKVKKLIKTPVEEYRVMRVSTQEEDFKELSKQQEQVLKRLNSSCLQALKNDLIKSERHSPMTMAVKSELYAGMK